MLVQILLAYDVDEYEEVDMLKTPSSWYLFVNLINKFCRIYAMILEMMIGMLDDIKLDKCAFLHKMFEKIIFML